MDRIPNGTRCRILTRQELAERYQYEPHAGLFRTGAIVFIKEMAKYCGLPFTVRNSRVEGNFIRYFPEEDYEPYIFTGEMLTTDVPSDETDEGPADEDVAVLLF